MKKLKMIGFKGIGYKGIGIKLWGIFIALVAFMLLLLWFFQIVFLENFYINMHISGIIREATSISNKHGDKLTQEFVDDIEEFTYRNNLNLEVVDVNKAVILKAGDSRGSSAQPFMRNTARSFIVDKALSGEMAKSTLMHPRFDIKYSLVGIPIFSSANANNTSNSNTNKSFSTSVNHVFLMNIPFANVEDTASILKVQLIYITVILLFATTILAFFISRSMTRPILRIKEVTESISRGNLGVKLNLTRDDEIGDLADSIDYMSDELSKVEQLRKDLIANVSHELRTPLSLIRGYAETIKDVSGEDVDKRNKGLNIIIDESKRLGYIVDDILSLSQLQSGNFKLNTEDFPISEAVKDIIRNFEVLIAEKKIEFAFKSLDGAIVHADRRKIEQVIYNLLGNAINYTPKGGTVAVKIDVVNTLFKVSIWNSGRVISSTEIEHVWERYYRTETNDGNDDDNSNENNSSSNSSNSGSSIAIGTGLGLAIVKNILETHNFEYGVESAEGEGTTFWFLCCAGSNIER